MDNQYQEVEEHKWELEISGKTITINPNNMSIQDIRHLVAYLSQHNDHEGDLAVAVCALTSGIFQTKRHELGNKWYIERNVDTIRAGGAIKDLL